MILESDLLLTEEGTIVEELADFFHEGPDSKYPRFCGSQMGSVATTHLCSVGQKHPR